MTLKQKTFSAVRWTTTAAVARGGLQLAQIAVLARLLEPADYGLMAMVGVVLSFAVLFADLGLNSAYVHKQDVTLEQRSSLFWLNIGMSSGLTLLVILASHPLALFFGDERLTPVLMLSATTFIINSLGQQVRITAEKNLNFKPVVSIEVASAVLGFATAVVAALYGMGVYALVFGSIVTSLTGTALAWMFIAGGWRPLWRFRTVDVRPYIGFGGAMVGNGIANQINMNMDLLLGGRLLGAGQLGLFSVPRNLILQIQFMVNPIITRVGFPLIAQVQGDLARVRRIYLQTLNMTASINAPLYIGLAFFAPEIVQVLLGKNWAGSVEFLRILAIWGALRSTGNPVGSLLFGMGRADLSFKWNVAMLFIVPPVLWAGAQYGANGLAWALLTFLIVMTIPGWYVLVRPLCQASLGEYITAAFKPMLIAALAITPAYWISKQLGDATYRLTSGIVMAAPMYLVISYKLNRDWINAMMTLLGRRSPA